MAAHPRTSVETSATAVVPLSSADLASLPLVVVRQRDPRCVARSALAILETTARDDFQIKIFSCAVEETR